MLTLIDSFHVHHWLFCDRCFRRFRWRFVGLPERSGRDLRVPLMLDHEDLKWIATTSTELNSMLQQIARYADLARQHKGEYNYIEMLGERVELASKTAQKLFDHVTSRILEGTTPKSKGGPDPTRTPEFKVVRGPNEVASKPRGSGRTKPSGAEKKAAAALP